MILYERLSMKSQATTQFTSLGVNWLTLKVLEKVWKELEALRQRRKIVT